MNVDRHFEHLAGGGFDARIRSDAHFVRVCLGDNDAEFHAASLSGHDVDPTGDLDRFCVLPSSDWVALPGESQDEFKHRIVADLDWADAGRHIAYLRSSLVC